MENNIYIPQSENVQLCSYLWWYIKLEQELLATFRAASCLPEEEPALLPLRSAHAVSIICHHVAQCALPLDLQEFNTVTLQTPCQPQLLAPALMYTCLGSIWLPDTGGYRVHLRRCPALPDLPHPIYHTQAHVPQREAFLETGLWVTHGDIFRASWLAQRRHPVPVEGGACSSSTPSAVHAVQRFAGGTCIFPALVELVVVGGKWTALNPCKGCNCVLGSWGSTRWAGLPCLIYSSSKAVQEVSSKVTREAGVSSRCVVAWVLCDKLTKLVGKVGSRSTGMQLAELFPVGQRARGELRAAGRPVTIHPWAMPTPWQCAAGQKEKKWVRHPSVEEEAKETGGRKKRGIWTGVGLGMGKADYWLAIAVHVWQYTKEKEKGFV